MSGSFVCVGSFVAVIGSSNDGLFKGTPEQVEDCLLQVAHRRIREFSLPEGMVKVGTRAQAMNVLHACWQRSHDQTSPQGERLEEKEDADGYTYLVEIVRRLHTCPWTGQKWYTETTVY